VDLRRHSRSHSPCAVSASDAGVNAENLAPAVAIDAHRDNHRDAPVGMEGRSLCITQTCRTEAQDGVEKTQAIY